MEVIEDIKEKVKRALAENTGYRLAKETGIGLYSIQRLQNGDAEIETVPFKTVEKLYEFAKKNEKKG